MRSIEDENLAPQDKRVARRPSAAQQLGTAARAVTNAGRSPTPFSPTGVVGAVDAAVRTATTPLRASVAQGARDFIQGASGRPQPEPAAAPAPTPVAAATSGNTPAAALPAYLQKPKPVPAQGGVDSTAPTVTAGPQSPVVPPAPFAPTLKPGDVNTFTGSNGVTRAVPGLLNASAGAGAAAQRPVAMAQPQVATRRPTPAGSGAVAATIGIPGEDQRRQEIALASATSGTARSRGARGVQAQLVQGINDSFAQRRGNEAAANNALLDANTRRGIAGQELAARAAEGDADRAARLQEVGLNNESSERNARFARRPEVITTESGGMGTLGENGSLTPITGPDGQQVRAQRTASAAGTLTQGDLLKSYTDRRVAIENGLGDQTEKVNSLAQLDADPLYAPLRGGQDQGGPPPQAIADLQANPNAAAQFDEIFGSGASARYLNR